MGPGEHRPNDEEYWQRPWARALFAGDLFEAIPFGDQPTVVYTAEQDDTSGKHFLGEVAFGYGLLITPTRPQPAVQIRRGRDSNSRYANQTHNGFRDRYFLALLSRFPVVRATIRAGQAGRLLEGLGRAAALIEPTPAS